MFGLIPKNRYSSKESVWPENMINYIIMVLIALEIYKTENRILNYYKTLKQMEIVYITENVFKYATIAEIIFLNVSRF